MQKSVIFIRKNLRINMLLIRNINKLEIIATTQVNIEVVQIAYIIQSIEYLKTFL